GGDLGYFTALQMVYPFEDAAYKTPKGQISMPVRTRFGYHLIYVKDKRPSQGQVKVSHIMVRATQGISAEDSIAARKKIYEIYEQLRKGADWFEMANQYSDDIASKASGGALPWFGTGSMIPEFENAAFSLSEEGKFSEPIKTAYGWHIIRLDDKKPLEPFEVLQPTLEMKVSKDSRAELNKAALIKRLKQENDFRPNDEMITAATEDIDSSLVMGQWTYTAENQALNNTLFTIKDKAYTVKDFYDYITEKQRPQRNMTVEQYMQVLYEQFSEEQLIAYVDAHLPEKYNEYRMLLKEYRDGILQVELMDKKIWSKAVEDTAGLRNFYEQHLSNYQWGERAKARIYVTTSQQKLDSVKTKNLLNQDDLENKDLALNVFKGEYEQSDLPVLSKISWAPGTYDTQYDNRYYYIVVEEILPPVTKKLNEIRGQVISDYQNHLEKEWVSVLREKHEVQINDEVLNYVLEQIENQ